jgi:hypothetical protein
LNEYLLFQMKNEFFEKIWKFYFQKKIQLLIEELNF